VEFGAGDLVNLVTKHVEASCDFAFVLLQGTSCGTKVGEVTYLPGHACPLVEEAPVAVKQVSLRLGTQE
jgi:hypothetical protein